MSTTKTLTTPRDVSSYPPIYTEISNPKKTTDYTISLETVETLNRLPNVVKNEVTNNSNDSEYLSNTTTYPKGIIDGVTKAKENKRTDIHSDDLAYLTIWDFAGQDIFFDTHHMFLTDDGIYIFVFNVEEWKENSAQITGMLNYKEI